MNPIVRTAKTTPKKIGQFVSIWKRNKEGVTTPRDLEDDFDFLIIQCETETQKGRFVFPKIILAKKGIISTVEKEGKRGIRVYPPWDKAENKQAIKTQQWQLKYFELG